MTRKRAKELKSEDSAKDRMHPDHPENCECVDCDPDSHDLDCNCFWHLRNEHPKKKIETVNLKLE